VTDLTVGIECRPTSVSLAQMPFEVFLRPEGLGADVAPSDLRVAPELAVPLGAIDPGGAHETVTSTCIPDW